MSARVALVSGTVRGVMTRACRLIPLLAAAVCAVAALPVARSTLMRTMDLAELTAIADQIVVGDVLSTESAWDSGHRNIYTTIDIGVRESWKGAPPSDGRIRPRRIPRTSPTAPAAASGLTYEPRGRIRCVYPCARRAAPG